MWLRTCNGMKIHSGNLPSYRRSSPAGKRMCISFWILYSVF